MVYNFLCKDEKNTQKYLLTFAKNIGVERSPPFFRTVYPNRNHVTTHPVDGQRQDGRMPGGLLYPMKFACQGVNMFKLQLQQSVCSHQTSVY